MRSVFTFLVACCILSATAVSFGQTVSDGVLTAWDGATGDIVIPSEVTSVAGSVFLNNTNITSVSGSNVISIGASAFQGCTNVISYSFPNLEVIGKSAFKTNSKLTSIDISKVVSIDESFHSCSVLSSITAPLLTTIGNYSFYNCTSLVSVNFPEALTLGTGALQGCSKLSSVSMPKLTSIGQDTFKSTKLVSASFPLLTTIGKSAFQSCTTLTSFNAPLLESIGESSFHTTGLTSANFPAAKSIGNYGFYNITSLAQVTFDAMETIGAGAFSAQSANIPNMSLIYVYMGRASNLTTVASDAFVKTKTDLTVYVNNTNKINLFPADRQYTVTVDPTSNMNSEVLSNLKIYPNPSRDLIHVSIPENTTAKAIQIFDVTGKVVLQREVFVNQVVMSVSSLPKGQYLIKAGDLTTKFSLN